MTNPDERAAHWDDRYRKVGPAEVSWFEDEAKLSLELLDLAGVTSGATVIDVGGGAAPLAGALVDRGHDDVTVLDLSTEALDQASAALTQPDAVHWVVADLLQWSPTRRYDVWHDRAVFHFLVDPDDRAAYRAVLRRAIRPNGTVIVATFAEDGPTMCSGLPVRRYSAEELVDELGPGLTPVATGRHDHVTPAGGVQHFTWVVLKADPA
jgi:2-polyprenyl-3-methyl-5-hydroxy-6-metoxy-1,4-benzoquinol methylase